MSESIKSGDVIEMPCLGRPFTMGMLYDCRKDAIIPGLTLWKDATIRDALHSEEKVEEGCEIIAEDTLESKAFHLDIGANLKLSLLGGLVDVKGSAKYLYDRTSSIEQSRVSLKYWSTSRFDQLTMTHLGNIEFPDVFRQKVATHVVVGIQYGADAFFVFDQKVENGENKHNVTGDMQAVLKKTFDCVLDITAGGELNITADDTQKTNKFQCKFHGDIHLKSNPTTFESAIKTYQELPSRIREGGTTKVVPKRVWLYPLIKLDSNAARIVTEISVSLVNQAQEVMEEMLGLENQTNDLLDINVTAYLSGLKILLNSFKTRINEYRLIFSQKLNQILPKIREGGENESALADLLKQKRASPFASDQLSTWMTTKQQEIKVLDGYFQAMRKIESIEMAFSPGALDKLVNDLSIDRVICFSFKVIASTDVFIQQMQDYLRKGKCSSEKIVITSWTGNKEIISRLRQQARQFTEFAAANIGSEETAKKFVVTEFEGCGEACDGGAQIVLYTDGVANQFSPPLKPNNITASADGIKHNSITLAWNEPTLGSESVQCFVVSYNEKEESEKHWKKMKTKGKELSCLVDNLQPQTAYRFKVQAICDAGMSGESEVVIISTLSLPADRLATVMLNKSSKISHIPADATIEDKSTHSISVYKLPQTETHSVPGQRIRTVEVGERPRKQEVVHHKVLLVVGATGAGKTTLINGMVNYVLKVQWKDNFRFKLIVDELTTQTQSVTKEITAYTIHKMEGSSLQYTITIIDTPGFGDTSGIKRDKEITEQMQNFFSFTQQYGIDHLDGIGFVTQSALVRLTPTQQYIFDSILAVFGNDVANNIFILVTFCDGQEPPVIKAVNEANIPYSKYFKFNSSALEADNSSTDEDNFDEIFWRMGMRSYKNFFEKFQCARSVSLTLTQEVLEIRAKLETAVQGLQAQMNACLAKMEVLHQEESQIQEHERDLEMNKDFECEIKVPFYETIHLQEGEHVTNCLNCNFTCHFPCYTSDGDEKWKCSAMDSNWKDILTGETEISSVCCTICSGKCSWKVHKNTKERFELHYRTEKRTSEDLKRKFDAASNEKSRVERMIKCHAEKLEKENAKLHALIEEACECLENLNEIALKPNPLTQVDYIQLLIESEQKQAKKGWSERVTYLEETKEQAILLTTISDIKDVDKRIVEEKKKKGPGWELKVENLEKIKRIKQKVDEHKSSGKDVAARRSVLATISASRLLRPRMSASQELGGATLSGASLPTVMPAIKGLYQWLSGTKS